MFYNLFILFLLSISLNAKEPVMAILKNVYTNDEQQFTYMNYSFLCQPYGIVSLEDIYRNPKVSVVCKKKIIKFYIKNPNLKYFSARLMDISQMYHIEVKENLRCLIFANGMRTLSEELIRNGLAIKKPYLKDEIYGYKFDIAQKRASFYKLGLHKDSVLKNCMIFYKG